jgi:DNA-binding transcriptional ArsR family regulator
LVTYFAAETITDAAVPAIGETPERRSAEVAAKRGCRYLRLQGTAERNPQREKVMLSGEALDVAFALRAQVGPLSQGDGSAAAALCEATGLPQPQFERALAELESVGFIAIDRRSTDDVAIVVLAPLQIYLDDLESQGSDDF